jgi:GT2 family glycosyltransferase
MINVVMLVRDRPKLTRQALHTFTQNTDDVWTLTLIDDASQPETRDLLRSFARNTKNVALLRNEVSKGIVGQARNLGVYWSDRFFLRGQRLVLADNDIAFNPKWASTMQEMQLRIPVAVLGGQRHPYHGVNDSQIPLETNVSGKCVRSSGCVEITDAVAGYLQMMPWQAWDEFGPLDAHAPGVCQSEDFAFCQKIVKAGRKVGYIHPPVVIHTGLTRTDGSPAVGAEAMERVAGVYYE